MELYFPRFCLLLSLALSALLSLSACSHHQKEVISSESSSSSNSGANPDGRASYNTHEESRTVESQPTQEGDCGGVLSCTVNVLGEIIALPFKAVGFLVQAIF